MNYYIINSMETITFKEFQNKVVGLYNDVSTFFDSIDLIWWVHSGTLLAIKRENKLILDWDDDIDLMVPYNDWKRSTTLLKNFCDQNKFIYFDLLGKDFKYLSYSPYAQIFSGEKFNVVLDDNTEIILTPFVDIFFAVDNNIYSEKEWKKYSKIFPLRWIFNKKFDKYPYSENNKFLKFIINVLTYLVPFLCNKVSIDEFLLKPFNQPDAKALRRADYWSHRDVIYDIENGLEHYEIDGSKVVTNVDWENELINSFGSNWNIPKIRKMHFQNKEKNIYNKYRNDILKKLDN